MKRRRLPPSPHLKRRYNIAHRLRLKGVAITTDANAIEITEAQYSELPKAARRYCDELRDRYHYVIQLRIPD